MAFNLDHKKLTSRWPQNGHQITILEGGKCDLELKAQDLIFGPVGCQIGGAPHGYCADCLPLLIGSSRQSLSFEHTLTCGNTHTCAISTSNLLDFFQRMLRNVPVEERTEDFPDDIIHETGDGEDYERFKKAFPEISDVISMYKQLVGKSEKASLLGTAIRKYLDETWEKLCIDDDTFIARQSGEDTKNSIEVETYRTRKNNTSSGGGGAVMCLGCNQLNTRTDGCSVLPCSFCLEEGLHVSTCVYCMTIRVNGLRIPGQHTPECNVGEHSTLLDQAIKERKPLPTHWELSQMSKGAPDT